MYDNSNNALLIVRKIMAKENLKTQHRVLLDLPPQWCNYLNETRLHNENEVIRVEKTTLANLGIIESNPSYNKELVKIVSQKQQTEVVPLTDITQFRMYQGFDEISYWLKDERVLKDCRRISLHNGVVYKALEDIPRADKDPALLLTNKWEAIPEEEEV